MSLLETYMRELRDIRSTGAGVKETSYYPALSNLFNEIGKTLKPKVKCVLQLANRGAGSPDGGFFTPDQFQKSNKDEPIPGAIPSRGVIEVKGTGDDAWVTADGRQVTKYWDRYGLVLVTNYRDFVLVGKDAEGNPVKLETYRLASSEKEFWQSAANPRKLANEQGARFEEYVKRVLLHSAPLERPEDLAWFLASYARDAKARIEGSELQALGSIRAALEEALGIKFEGEKGDHFFRSTLIQTLFYGIFSSWVLWSKKHKPTDRKVRFNWHEAAWSLHVPMIRALFEQVATPSRLGPLGLEEVLDWTASALNRVDRANFFANFEEGHAVQYFYEPFLKAFDPELRKELGVWYTPPEIVTYMVERVNTVLREELELPDGLADPNVYVLDPCTGTGSFLVETLKRINRTFEEQGAGALGGEKLKKAAKERVFGFEILPAPFVVAHLQLGLLLQNLGVPLSDKNNERVGVYLTNALTGWEPPKEPQRRLIFPELEEERDAAEHVKRDKPILVILGNPPYNAFAGVSPTEERGLVEPYKEGLVKEWKIKKFNLDDLYVRFFRLAERRIAEKEPYKGIVCYISNFSYLSDPSFVVMRKKFMNEFDKAWFDCMNGDSRETGKLTPDGKPDPSVFSTEYNREGIRVGTTIGLMVRKAEREKEPTVRFRHFWGVDKRGQLVDSLKAETFDAQYVLSIPDKTNLYSFRPSSAEAHYIKWPKLVELCAVPPINGLMEKRGGALIDIDRAALESRMSLYYNPKVDWTTLKSLNTGLTNKAAGFEPQKVRSKVKASEIFNPEKLSRYALRPFETRWCYYSVVAPLWNRSRPSLWAQCWKGNSFLMARPTGVASPEGVPLYFTGLLGDNDFLRGHAYYFPLQLKDGSRLRRRDEATLFDLLGEKPEEAPVANLSAVARAYLKGLGLPDPDQDIEAASFIWLHALAIGYSPLYLSENADGIKQDWPRIPLPGDKGRLMESAKLGRQVAALLDTEDQVSGVTSGKVRSELREVAVITKVGGGNLNFGAGESALTAGWGHGGKDGVTMPGKGKIVERNYDPEEMAAIINGVTALGLSAEQALAHLGGTTCDIYLNETAYWKNIPRKVWDYTIGGYQVIKKWLSYRERDLLGRALTAEEITEVTNMARRIAAIVLLEPDLDKNYVECKGNSYMWKQ